MLDAAGGGEPAEDEAGFELQPRFGEFPTERRYYSTLVIDRRRRHVRRVYDFHTNGSRFAP